MDPSTSVLGQLEAFNRLGEERGAIRLGESFVDKCTLVDHAAPQRLVVGRSAVVDYWLEFVAALPDCHLECDGLIANGGAVAAPLRLTGTHVGGSLRGRPPAGNRVDLPMCAVWKLDGDLGAVAELHLYYDGCSLDGQVGRGVT